VYAQRALPLTWIRQAQQPSLLLSGHRQHCWLWKARHQQQVETVMLATTG